MPPLGDPLHTRVGTGLLPLSLLGGESTGLVHDQRSHDALLE